MAFCDQRKCKKCVLLLFLLLVLDLCIVAVEGGEEGSGTSPAHHTSDGHDHHHHHHHHHGCGHSHHDDHPIEPLLPEELAEEEDMKLYGFGFGGNYQDHHHHGHRNDLDSKLTSLGLWSNALGCSLLVSLASLICLIILPVIFVQGKPSKAVVDSLALFGAGAMLGDSFLHQLPHAFGGGHSHSHSHSHDTDHSHHTHAGHGHSHAHSWEDLSIGLSVLAGIVLFLLVEKVVRYVEDHSAGASAWSHGHHHHHNHQSIKKLKDEDDANDIMQSHSTEETEGKGSNEVSDDSLNGDNLAKQNSLLRKRKTTVDAKDDISNIDGTDGSTNTNKLLMKETSQHNFTDGMALGSAFLLYGSVGGWSRTLFLLAHELPQEIGDFGILVRSGFSVSKALFFNFLSALMALAGTALALLWGRDPGQSSLIEGFTAGGFIYISVAGVLAEMNNSSSTFRSSAVQIISLVLGMAVALCISLVE